MDQGHNSLFDHTGTSDPGAIFCCNPNSNEGYCKNGNQYDLYRDGEVIEYGMTTVCSEPSFGANDKFYNILTGNRNHQMFAYCPSISHTKCGVVSDDGSDHEMVLEARLDKQVVESTEMRYKKRTFDDPTREYDSCHYEVTFDTSVLENYNPKKIHIHISRKKEMNVFIYGGASKREATESIIDGNQQVTVGETYSIDPSKGFVVVAYPNENVATEFAFNYWLEAEIKPVEPEVTDDEETETSDGKPVTGYEVVEVETIDPIVTPDSETPSDEESSSTKTTGKEPSSGGKAISTSRITDPQPVADENADTLFYILCGGAVVILIVIVALCFKCRK